MEKKKIDPTSINKLVNEVCEKTHKDILGKLNEFEDGQRFLIYSRIVLRLFQAHFGYVMRDAETKVMKDEIENGKKG